MKKILLFFLLTACCSIIVCAQMSSERREKADIHIDSFMYHYKKLDATIRTNPYDTSAACAYSVVYMEKLTGMAAHPDGNLFGWRSFSRQDLISWKEWYHKNKKKKSGMEVSH